MMKKQSTCLLTLRPLFVNVAFPTFGNENLETLTKKFIEDQRDLASFLIYGDFNWLPRLCTFVPVVFR